MKKIILMSLGVAFLSGCADTTIINRQAFEVGIELCASNGGFVGMETATYNPSAGPAHYKLYCENGAMFKKNRDELGGSKSERG